MSNNANNKPPLKPVKPAVEPQSPQNDLFVFFNKAIFHLRNAANSVA